MIHLDTSFLIRALVPKSTEDIVLRRWLRSGEPLSISVLAWTEFLCGPVPAEAIAIAADLLGEPAPFDRDDAVRAAQYFNASGRRRGSLVDCMIAASAVGADVELASSNPADFRRFEVHGLKLAAS